MHTGAQVYTGLDLADIISEGYDFTWLFPNAESWRRRFRQATCYVIKADGSKMTALRACGVIVTQPLTSG